MKNTLKLNANSTFEEILNVVNIISEKKIDYEKATQEKSEAMSQAADIVEKFGLTILEKKREKDDGFTAGKKMNDTLESLTILSKIIKEFQKTGWTKNLNKKDQYDLSFQLNKKGTDIDFMARFSFLHDGISVYCEEI